MRAAIAIAWITIRQVLDARRLTGLGLLALAPGFILFLSTSQQTDQAALRNFIELSAGFFYNVVVPVITLILTAASLGDERRDGTLSFLVLRPQPRWLIAAAKIAGAAGSAMAICAVGGMAMATVYGLRTESWEYVWPMIVGSVLASGAYAAVFVPLGYITERAVAIGLAYVFIWEQGIVGAIGSLATLSPWRIGYSAFAALIPEQAQRFVPEFALGTLEPGFGGSVIKAALFLAVSIALTSLILQRRDLT